MAHGICLIEGCGGRYTFIWDAISECQLTELHYAGECEWGVCAEGCWLECLVCGHKVPDDHPEYEGLFDE